MNLENNFFIWEEKNSIEASQNSLNNPTTVPNDTINETKKNATENQWKDIGDKKNKKAGIYKIINQVNKKYYIGSSNFLWNRKRQHISRLKNQNHHNIYLQRAWNKYGLDNFKFVIIEFVDINKLIEIEQNHLNVAKKEKEISGIRKWWACSDLNREPKHYECSALTN